MSGDYDYYSSSNYTAPSAVGGGVGAIMGFLTGISIVIWLIAIAVAVVTVIGEWMAFKKAGRKGYEALIPGHSLWVKLQLAGLEGYMIFLMVLAVIPIVGGLIGIGLNIWWSIELAKSYGKGAGFGVGLALVPCVFWPILGFGNAQYVGPAAKRQPAPVAAQPMYGAPQAGPVPQPGVVYGQPVAGQGQPVAGQPVPQQPVQQPVNPNNFPQQQ